MIAFGRYRSRYFLLNTKVVFPALAWWPRDRGTTHPRNVLKSAWYEEKPGGHFFLFFRKQQLDHVRCFDGYLFGGDASKLQIIGVSGVSSGGFTRFLGGEEDSKKNHLLLSHWCIIHGVTSPRNSLPWSSRSFCHLRIRHKLASVVIGLVVARHGKRLRQRFQAPGLWFSKHGQITGTVWWFRYIWRVFPPFGCIKLCK